MRPRCAFTLVELLVVVAIIALLLGILLPAISKVRQLAKTAKCLGNLRNMEVAHQMYISEYRGRFVNVGLAHGGMHANEQGAWITTLEEQYGNPLLHRSPVDDSPHWSIEDGGRGEPVPGTTTQFRRTSYGVNNFLTDINGNGLNPFGKAPAGFSADWPGGNGKAYDRISRVPKPSSTVHFLMMAFEGDFAGADHPHVENWLEHPSPPLKASQQVEINAHGDEDNDASWAARTNWGFVDGHAETLKFEEVFTDIHMNKFDPLVAQ